MRFEDMDKIVKGANSLSKMKLYLRRTTGNNVVIWATHKGERKSLGLPALRIADRSTQPQELALLKKAVAMRDRLENERHGLGALMASRERRLSAMLQEWTGHYAQASTRKGACSSAKRFLASCGDLPIGSVSRSHLVKLIDGMEKKGCSPNYIRVTVSRIRAFCNWANQRGHMDRVDTRKLAPPEVFGEVKALGEEEIRALAAAPCGKHPDVKDLFMLGVYTAQRMGEMEGYTFSMLYDRQIRTRQGKTGKFIIIPLSEAALGVMERLRARRQGEGKPTGAKDKMFRLPHEIARRRAFREWLEAAGLPEGRITPHNSRSTAISLLIKKGVPESVTQELANHASPVITARYYRQIDTEQKKAALDKLPEF
jgi:integrase